MDACRSAAGDGLRLLGGAPTSDGAYVRLPREILAGRTDLTVPVRRRWAAHAGTVAVGIHARHRHDPLPVQHPVQRHRAAAHDRAGPRRARGVGDRGESGARAGTAPELLPTVRGDFTDGYPRQIPAVWSAVDPASDAQPGIFTVSGTAAGRPVTATVTVTHESQLIVDFSRDTGAFHSSTASTVRVCRPTT